VVVLHGYALCVDPVHFSVIFLVGAAIGFITPPFGLNLFVASGTTGIPYAKIVPFAILYMSGLVVAWMLIAFVPWFSLAMQP
jgi:C4-dicarboxylate transporter DctM subunit